MVQGTGIDGNTLIQLIALLVGGGSVSAGTAWWHRKVGPTENGLEEAVSTLKDGMTEVKTEVREAKSSIHRRIDNVSSELREAAIEREGLKTQIALLKQKNELTEN